LTTEKFEDDLYRGFAIQLLEKIFQDKKRNKVIESRFLFFLTNGFIIEL